MFPYCFEYYYGNVINATDFVIFFTEVKSVQDYDFLDLVIIIAI